MNGSHSIALSDSLIDHFRIDVLHENYGATIDLGACNQPDTVIDLLREHGYEITNERASIYTVKYES